MSFVSSVLSTWTGAPSIPTPAPESLLPSPTAWIGNPIQARNNAPSFSSFPTAWEIERSLRARDAKPSLSTPSTRQSSHSSQAQDADPTLATQVDVGVDPDICTSYKTSVEINMMVPTGIIRLKPKQKKGPAWGNMGTIWNIRTGDGAKLIDMKAACQGSGCTGINGEYNKENSGEMTQREDGSWYMTVTRDMKESLMISGQLVADTTTNPSRKYPLHVSGSPQCGLILAKNCTDSTFFTDEQQWPAYQMDEHMKELISGSSSIDDFGERILSDTMSTSETKNQRCKIDSPRFDCELPTVKDCADISDAEHARKELMRASYVGVVSFMAMVHDAIGDVAQTIGTEIASVVTHLWKKVAESNWTKIAAVVSSAIGAVLIVAAVIIQFFTAGTGTAAALALAGVASTIFLSNAAGIAGNIGNLVNNPAAPDTQTKKATQYTLEAYKELNSTQKALRDSMKNPALGSDGLEELFRGGSWSATNMKKILEDGGIKRNVTSWYSRSLVGEYTTRSLLDFNKYALFVKYGDDVKWARQKIGFSKEDCEKRFVGNPNWKYTAVCDVSYRPGGDLGMAVLTAPRQGNSDPKITETQNLFDGKAYNADHEITGRDILVSSMHGQYMHGFGFKLADKNWAKDLSVGGMEAVQKQIMDREPDEAGLYSLPTCEITNLVYLPQSNLAMGDWKGLGTEWSPDAKGPCSCADYEFAPEGGEKGKFRDNVGQAVLDTIMDCGVWLGALGKKSDKDNGWKYGDGDGGF